MKTQYQKELEQVKKDGGDVEQFKEDWHHRACAVYRLRCKDSKSISDFRSGKFHIN